MNEVDGRVHRFDSESELLLAIDTFVAVSQMYAADAVAIRKQCVMIEKP